MAIGIHARWERAYIFRSLSLPGYCIYLWFLHTKPEWLPVDKSSYPPHYLVPPLWWMLSGGDWFQTDVCTFDACSHRSILMLLLQNSLSREGLPVLFLQGHWPTSQAICHCARVHLFSYLKLLIPSQQVNAQVVFASKSINIHSLACSPHLLENISIITICWFILNKYCISFVAYSLLLLPWSRDYFSR